MVQVAVDVAEGAEGMSRVQESVRQAGSNSSCPERGVVGGEAVQAEGAEDQLGDEGVVAGVRKAGDERRPVSSVTPVTLTKKSTGRRRPHAGSNC